MFGFIIMSTHSHALRVRHNSKQITVRIVVHLSLHAFVPWNDDEDGKQKIIKQQTLLFAFLPFLFHNEN